MFISDALFYTGTLAKLLNDPCAKGTDEHLHHLQSAQDIVVRAIRAAWDYWTLPRDGRARDLNSFVKPEDLIKLVEIFVSDTPSEKLREDRARDVSTVRVDLYVHGASSDRCRDVRYRFGSE